MGVDQFHQCVGFGEQFFKALRPLFREQSAHVYFFLEALACGPKESEPSEEVNPVLYFVIPTQFSSILQLCIELFKVLPHQVGRFKVVGVQSQNLVVILTWKLVAWLSGIDVNCKRARGTCQIIQARSRPFQITAGYRSVERLLDLRRAAKTETGKAAPCKFCQPPKIESVDLTVFAKIEIDGSRFKSHLATGTVLEVFDAAVKDSAPRNVSFKPRE